jgi:AcrR family transcriptional regulator
MAAVHPRQHKPFPLPSARERIDHAVYELFSRHGVRAVGIDAIVARSAVAKKTLYFHYPSKQKLALAFLQRRAELWTQAWLQEGREARCAQAR